MAQVVVVIAGRTYRMNCEDGQEPHIEKLAQSVDAAMERLRQSFGEIGDLRLSVMAALTIADELSEARAKIAGLERDKEVLTTECEAAQTSASARNAGLIAALTSATQRIEDLAKTLATKT